MIHGLGDQVAAQCFNELEDALRWLVPRGLAPGEVMKEPKDRLPEKYMVHLNAHTNPTSKHIHTRDVVYNLENLSIQVDPKQFARYLLRGSCTVKLDAHKCGYVCNAGTEGCIVKHESPKIWDFSLRNVKCWEGAGVQATHVPVGYHVSMERFRPLPWSERDVDVIFTGHPNVRRNMVIDDLRALGLHVVQMPHGAYGPARDRMLARAKLALNMLYYDNGTFPALRVAHLVANHVPVLSEVCLEGWEFVPTCHYNDLVRTAHAMVTRRREYLEHLAESAYVAFRMHPMQLPDV